MFWCPRLRSDGYECFIRKCNRKRPLKWTICFLELENLVKDVPEFNYLRPTFLSGRGELNPPEIWAPYLQYKSGIIPVYIPALTFREDGLESRAIV